MHIMSGSRSFMLQTIITPDKRYEYADDVKSTE